MIKQHITIEQWNELDMYDQDRWLKFIHDQPSSAWISFSKEAYDGCYKLTTIGQMIEFLQTILCDSLEIIIYSGDDEPELKGLPLCDGLWECVKKELNQNEQA